MNNFDIALDYIHYCEACERQSRRLGLFDAAYAWQESAWWCMNHPDPPPELRGLELLRLLEMAPQQRAEFYYLHRT